MQTVIKTLLKDISYAKEAVRSKYSNGVTEGNNNFIRVLKRILLDTNHLLIRETESLLQGNLKCFKQLKKVRNI